MGSVVSQPQGLVEVNGDYKSTCEMLYYSGLKSTILRPYLDSGGISVGTDPVGIYYSGNGTGDYIDAGIVNRFNSGWTIVASFVLTTTGSIKAICGNRDTGQVYIEELLLNTDANSNFNAGFINITLRDTSSNLLRSGTTSSVLQTNKNYTIVASFTGANTLKMYLNGQELSLINSNTGTPVNTGKTQHNFDVLNSNIATSHTNGSGINLRLFAKFTKALANPIGISLNPWQLLKEPSRLPPLSYALNRKGSSGTVTLDFAEGRNETSNQVLESGILSGALCEAFIMNSDSNSYHTTQDHSYLASLVSLTCGDIVPGVGFTVYARSLQKLTGRFVVRYVWSNP